ncbi:hypothetical protein C8R43DRAFT_1125047 [Mycena crocata]|nr:hypothetical protein C8R43DRAFT_1125047 [Mycena crocata]
MIQTFIIAAVDAAINPILPSLISSARNLWPDDTGFNPYWSFYFMESASLSERFNKLAAGLVMFNDVWIDVGGVVESERGIYGRLPSRSFHRAVKELQLMLVIKYSIDFARLNLLPAPLSFDLNPGRNYHSSIGSGLRFNFVEVTRRSSRFSMSTKAEIMFDNTETMVFASISHFKFQHFRVSLDTIIEHGAEWLFLAHSCSPTSEDDRSIGAYICGLQTLILQNMLNHSLLQFLGLNFVFVHLSPLRDHRIHDVSSSRERAELTDNRRTFLSRQNPPEANDALSGLAIHSSSNTTYRAPASRLNPQAQVSLLLRSDSVPGARQWIRFDWVHVLCCDSTPILRSESTRCESSAANRLNANPVQRIDTTRQRGGGGNATPTRMERPAHLGSIRRAWRGTRYAAT